MVGTKQANSYVGGARITRGRHNNSWRPLLSAFLLLLLFASSPLRLFASSPFTPSPLFAYSPAVGGEVHTVSNETREGRLRVFDEVWEAVRDDYYDPRLHGVDWQALRLSLRPLAAGAPDGLELYGVLRRLVGSLRDAHTRVYAPGERPDWRRLVAPVAGISLREVGESILVANVERDSEAERAGVRAGDELLTVDGARASALLARKLAEEAGASTRAAARLRALTRLFDGEPDAPVALTFEDARGRGRKQVRLSRRRQAREPEFSVRRAGRHRLVRFNLFTQETAAAFARALRAELRGAEALIIDLRDNGGGELEAMTDVASALLPAGLSLGRFTDRAGRVAVAPRTRPRLLYAAEAPAAYRADLLVLTSARTASAAEVLTAALRQHARARVVGEQTCGCVLGLRRRRALPDGGTLDLSELDYLSGAGQRLEARGIAPDELVVPTRGDLLEGRDPAVARAVEMLKRRR